MNCGLSPIATTGASLHCCTVARLVVMRCTSEPLTERFRQAFTGCLGRPGVVIDLSLLRFIDGAGLTALVGAVRRALDRSCEIPVGCAQTSLRKALVNGGLDPIVSVVGQTDDALAAVSPSVTPAARPTSMVAGGDVVGGDGILDAWPSCRTMEPVSKPWEAGPVAKPNLRAETVPSLVMRRGP
jgi:anti-anti-sigma regulatory factor